jgi:DHA3 family macrolide efflux protein-like MFS transporter
LMSLVYPLLTPMLLDMTSPDIVGLVASVGGLGMLAGTLIMSAWGGPKRRLYGIFGAELLAGLSILLTGLSPSIPLIAAAGMGMMFVLPISSACSQAIWQSKVAQDMQGRVFSIRSMIAFSILPLAYTVSGPLAEKVFEPAMAVGGRLATVFGPLIGVGPGRGIGLMYVLSGMFYMLVTAVLLIQPRIRSLEVELPDAISPVI